MRGFIQLKMLDIAIYHNILWMEEILHHFGWLKPYKYWDRPSTSWCRISSIHSITIFCHLSFFSMDPHSTYITTQCIWPWSHASTTRQAPRHWWGNRFVDLIAAVVADALEDPQRLTIFLWLGVLKQFIWHYVAIVLWCFVAFTKIIVIYILFSWFFVIWFIDTVYRMYVMIRQPIPVEVWNMILVWNRWGLIRPADICRYKSKVGSPRP